MPRELPIGAALIAAALTASMPGAQAQTSAQTMAPSVSAIPTNAPTVSPGSPASQQPAVNPSAAGLSPGPASARNQPQAGSSSQWNGALNPGHSGGPVLDSDGKAQLKPGSPLAKKKRFYGKSLSDLANPKK